MNIYTTTLATLTNPAIVALAEQMRKTVTKAMTDIKISQLLIDRGLVLAEISKDYIVEEHIDIKALTHMAATVEAEPARLFNGSDIIDGVLWPQDMTDDSMPEVLEMFRTLAETRGHDAAACICFMNFVIGEVMMERIA